MRILLIFLIISTQAFAANIEDHCEKFEHGFCVMKDSDIKNSNQVIIYFRGHWNYRGYVPVPEWESSIEQVIPYYGLKSSQTKLDIPIIISSSSYLELNTEKLNEFGIDSKKELIFASHSGGYLGLLNTLKNLKDTHFSIKKIIMLDNFYFGKGSSYLIKEYVDKGSECNGFYTQHNEPRLQSRFETVIDNSICPIEKKTQHNLTVNKCLVKYINGDRC